MKIHFISAVVLLSMTGCVTVHDIGAIRVSGADMGRALSAKDLRYLQNNFTADAMLFGANLPAIVGRDALLSRYQVAFQQLDYNLSFTSAEITRSGNFATDRGSINGSLATVGRGLAVPVAGNYLHVLKREGQGPWKIWRAAWELTFAPKTTTTGCPGHSSCCCKDGDLECKVDVPAGLCDAEYPIPILKP